MTPELMQETLLSDSDDESCDDLLDHNHYKYMATDDLKANYGQDQKNFDTTNTDHDLTDVSVLNKKGKFSLSNTALIKI